MLSNLAMKIPEPVTNVVPTKEITLIEVYNLIQGTEFATCTSTLRNIQDVKEARKYKAFNFDYVTFFDSSDGASR